MLLPLFTTRDACALRLVCREFLAAVSEHPWEDRGTVIQGSIAAWRACFPHARCVNVQRWDLHAGTKRTAPVVDADFVHFEGLRELHMALCMDATDAAFVHLRGIHTLDMTYCSQSAITDAAFAHLAGIQRLSIEGCLGISDAAFVHLRGVQLLNMGYCRQLTDAVFFSLARHSYACPGELLPARHHRRRLCAPTGHSHAGDELLRPGHHHWRKLLSPEGRLCAVHERLQ